MIVNKKTVFTYTGTSSFKGALVLKVKGETFTLKLNKPVNFDLTVKEFSELLYPKKHLSFTRKEKSTPVPKNEVQDEIVTEPVIEEIKVKVDEAKEVKEAKEADETKEEKEEPVADEPAKKPVKRGRKKSVKIETEENK